MLALGKVDKIVMRYRDGWCSVFLCLSVLLTAHGWSAGQELADASVSASSAAPLPSRSDPINLQRELTRLHVELTELTTTPQRSDTATADGENERRAQIARLRARLQELVLRIRLQQEMATRQAPPAPQPAPPIAKPTPPPPAPAPPSVPVPAVVPAAVKPPLPKVMPVKPPDTPSTAPKENSEIVLPPAQLGKAVDPSALAQALFQGRDYESALKAYRVLAAAQLRPADHVTVQYMIACCLRRLSKTDEAATLYREVANSHDNDLLADCARWQLNAIRWRQETTSQLEQFRQRRQAAEIKP